MSPRWKGKGAQAKALANPMSKFVSTLQSSLIQSDCQGTLSDNNILIGANTEQIDLFNNAYFGRSTISDEKDKHQLLLTMEEAFYLHFSLNCLKILVGENNCNQPEDKLWKYMTSRTEKFPDTFKAYSHLRNKNWVVRNGAQYGVDFVAYRHHPSLVHSEYAVLVLSDGNGDENDRLRVWSDYECTLRLCGVVVKTLLVLYINRNGRGADSQSCLEGYTVEERTITRWSPEQCREDKVKVKVKGAVDGGLDIPHSDKRFAGFDKEGKSLDADTHRKYIYGGHVAAYMTTLAEDEPEKYQTHFSDYIKAGVEADGIEEVYKKVHAAIRADPTLKKSEKQPPKEHKRYGFVLRIVLLLLVAWMTLLILNSAIVVVPISLGRALFNAVPLLPITHGIKCNDICAFVIGSYFIWTALAGVRYSIDQIKTRRARVLLGQIWKWFGIVMKSSALLLIWIFVIPVLIGLLFELLIIVPMRVPVDESPVFLLYQEWAFGLIFLKVWTRLVLGSSSCLGSEANLVEPAVRMEEIEDWETSSARTSDSEVTAPDSNDEENCYASGDLPKLQFRKQMSTARWKEDLGMAEVVSPKGKWTATGLVRNGKIYCTVEETLYLAQIGALHLLDNDDRCLKLEDLYKKVSEGKGGCCWDSFQVYRHMKKYGYIVQRHGVPWSMKSAKTKSTSVEGNSNINVTVDEGYEDDGFISELFSSIHINEVRTVFDVYPPNSKFKKSSPGKPTCVLCLTSVRPPSKPEIEELERQCNGIPPKLCNVDDGRVNFISFDRVELPVLP